MSAKSLVIILCILASILIVWQLVLPVYDKIAVIKQEVGQAQKKVEKLEELEAKLKDFAQTYKDKESSINKLYKIMPNGKDVPEILNRFESLSFQSGVILNSIDFSEVESEKNISQTGAVSASEMGAETLSIEQTGLSSEVGVKKLALDLKISGTYDAFRGFLDNLENCVRLADVQKLNFSFKGEGSDLADFNITADVYYK